MTDGFWFTFLSFKYIHPDPAAFSNSLKQEHAIKAQCKWDGDQAPE